MDITKHIEIIPLFRGLPDEHLKDLSMILKDKIYKRGQTIFSEGDEGSGFYAVISGRVKIYKLSAEGREQILHIFGPGEIFGEVALFAGRNFPAHALAMEESRVFFFSRESLIEMTRKDPSIALNMLALMSMRLRGFTMMIDDLSLKEVPGRLAAYLLFLSQQNSDSNDIRLDITKGQLAGLIGTVPETISRILAKMAGEGLIESEGPRIMILDKDGLEDLATGFSRI